MRVAVVGCGYVGLVSAVGLASVGHHVTGIEGDQKRREQVAAGIPPFHEPGLAALLETVQSEGRFAVTGDIAAARDNDIVFLAVQTPCDHNGAIDLDPLRAATKAVAAALKDDPRPRVIATRSTVVPGTAEQVVQPLLDVASPDGSTVAAANPEFLREGSAVSDFLHPDRVVIGCHAAWGIHMLQELYEPFGAPIATTTPGTAELAKYASNALLATLVSFSNEIARVCDDLPGVDVEDVLGIVQRDRRLRVQVGEQRIIPDIVQYLRAGCGYGGSCLPKDLSALITAREERGAETPLLQAVRTINDSQPERFVQLARTALGDLSGRRCAVLGLAFKAGTDDLRASPGLATVEALVREGAHVVAYDPLVDDHKLAAAQGGSVALAASLEEAVTGVDACLVTTADPAFARLPDLLSSGMEQPPMVIDGRRALPPTGFAPGTYRGIGRGPSVEPTTSDSVPAHPALPRQPNSSTAAASSSGVPMSQ